MKHIKLVRDKIPSIIIESGRKPITHIASEVEYHNALRNKLQEEVEEFLEDENIEELADILEVLYTLCDYMKIDREELEKIRSNKEDARGGFTDKIILEEA